MFVFVLQFFFFFLAFLGGALRGLFLTPFPSQGSVRNYVARVRCVCVCVCVRVELCVRAWMRACVCVCGRQGVMIMIWQQWEGTATTVAGPSTSPPLHTAAKCYG